MDRYEYALSGLQHPQLQLCINAQKVNGTSLTSGCVWTENPRRNISLKACPYITKN